LGSLSVIPIFLGGGGSEGLFFSIAGIGAGAISSIMLFKVTKNYFTIPRKKID